MILARIDSLENIIGVLRHSDVSLGPLGPNVSNGARPARDFGSNFQSNRLASREGVWDRSAFMWGACRIIPAVGSTAPQSIRVAPKL